MNTRTILHISILTLALLVIALLPSATPPAHAGGGTVTNCNDDTEFSSKLSGGGTIIFNCGPNPAKIVLSSTKTIAANTTIDGGNLVTLSGDNKRLLFYVSSGIRLELNNINIVEGYNGVLDGGAVQNYGTLNVTNSKFLSNVAAAPYSGGAILSYGVLNIANSEFGYNKGASGGAIYPRFGAVVTITGSSFHDNQATAAGSLGGAMLLWDGPQATVSNSSFTSNSATYAGGAIYLFGATSAITMTNSHVDTNTSGQFGYGGGIYNNGTLKVTGGTLNGNSSGIGGGIVSVLSATLNNLTVRGNSAHYVGGGVIGGLVASSAGLNSSSVNISASLFYTNTAQDSGGLQNYGGTMNVVNSTFAENSAARGGGVGNNSGVLTMVNATLVGNSASASGGGVYQYALGAGQPFILKNTIIANSTSGGNCFAVTPGPSTIQSAGFNLSSDNTCLTYLTQPGDRPPGTDPRLAPLGNTGGPTLTYLPLPQSDPIDKIPNNVNGCGTSITTDQRGAPRPINGSCDIGAVEYGARLLSLFLPFVVR